MADLNELDVAKKQRYRAELARTETLSREALAEYAQAQLAGIVQFGWRNVPYWRKRLAPVFAGGGFDAATFARVPPLTRQTIAAKLSELTPATVPDYAGPASYGLTSGSTGAPLRYRTSSSNEIASAALTERSFDWWQLQCHRSLAGIHFFPADWPNLVEG